MDKKEIQIVHKQQRLVNEIHDVLEKYDYDENLKLAHALAWLMHREYDNDTAAELINHVWKIHKKESGKEGGTINDLTEFWYKYLTEEK